MVASLARQPVVCAMAFVHKEPQMKFAPKCSFYLATISILFVGAWRLQRTQDTYAQEVIKVQTAEVLIDAIVTDHHNKLVNDLTADDFVVYEDGVPQKVVGFRVSRGTAPVRRNSRHRLRRKKLLHPRQPASRNWGNRLHTRSCCSTTRR